MNHSQQKPGADARTNNSRRGTIVVLTAVMIIAFLASVVLSVDVAYMQLTKAKLRAATDAASRAAGEGLSREQDTNYARQAAKNIAAANQCRARFRPAHPRCTFGKRAHVLWPRV
jgi:Flp pilus assembly protein TadG